MPKLSTRGAPHKQKPGAETAPGFDFVGSKKSDFRVSPPRTIGDPPIYRPLEELQRKVGFPLLVRR